VSLSEVRNIRIFRVKTEATKGHSHISIVIPYISRTYKSPKYKQMQQNELKTLVSSDE